MSRVEPAPQPLLNSIPAPPPPPQSSLPAQSPKVARVTRQGTSSSSTSTTSTLTASPPTDAVGGGEAAKEGGQEAENNHGGKSSSPPRASPARPLSGTSSGRQQQASYRASGSSKQTEALHLPSTAPKASSPSMASSLSPSASPPPRSGAAAAADDRDRSTVDGTSPRSGAVGLDPGARRRLPESDRPSEEHAGAAAQSAGGGSTSRQQQRGAQEAQGGQQHRRSYSEDDRHRMIMMQQQMQMQQQQMQQQQMQQQLMRQQVSIAAGPSPVTSPDREAFPADRTAAAAAPPGSGGGERSNRRRTHSSGGSKHHHHHKSHGHGRSHHHHHKRTMSAADAADAERHGYGGAYGAVDPIMAAQMAPPPPGPYGYPPPPQPPQYYYQQGGGGGGVPGQYAPYHPQQQQQQQIGQPGSGAPPRTPTKGVVSGERDDTTTPPPRSSSRRGRRTKSLSAPTGGDLFGTPPPHPGGAGRQQAGGYGAVGHTFPGPPRRAAPHYNGAGGGPVKPSTTNFSPRKELLALSGGNFSSSSQGASPGGAGGGQNPRQHRARSSSYGDRIPGLPPVSRLSPLRESRPAPDEDLQNQLSPLLRGGPAVGGERSLMGVYSAPRDGSPREAAGGGEAEAFLPQNISRAGGSGSGGRGSSRPGGSSHRKSASFRKMHMRQQSVELFMDDIKGTDQPRACRDVLFALLFYAQIGAMLYVGIRFGKDAVRPGALDELELGTDDDTTTEKTDEIYETYHNVIVVACLCGAFSVAMSALALFVMMAIARRLVQVALMFSIGMAFAWGTIGIGLSPKSFVPITGIIALALSVGYALVVWERIPFATSNLHAALSGIRVNLGVVGMAFVFQALTLALSIYYTFAVIGLFDAIKFGDVNLSGAPKVLAFVGVGLAYYWTYQVIVHVVQVTVAGIIGSWWFKPDSSSSPCSEALSKSFIRSTLLSFGSVCFGSLLVGFVQVLRQFAEPIRPNRDESVLMCLHECLVCFQECIVSCVDSLADSFTPWAFTYVGLYGYGFLDAGHNATELFRKRGWTKIVTDDLIPNVLFMVSIVIGGVTGCFALLIEAIDGYQFHSVELNTMTAFLIGLAVGIVLSSVLFSIISSSVNAVIVCFAGSPVEFQRNHPELSDEMRHSWREVWPGCMDIVDLKISMAV